MLTNKKWPADALTTPKRDIDRTLKMMDKGIQSKGESIIFEVLKGK